MEFFACLSKWFLTNWEKEPFAILGFLTSFIVLVIIVYNFLKDKPKVIVEIGKCEIIRRETDSVFNIEIRIKNKGRRPVQMCEVGVSYPNGEKILEDTSFIIDEEEFFFRSYSTTDFNEGLITGVESGKYVAFATNDAGKRYRSSSRLRRIKKKGGM